jgi:CRP-like cAMP-binding protein
MTQEESRSLLLRRLSTHPLLRGLDQGQLEDIVAIAAPAEFASGETIFRAGGPAERFYLIRTGLVALEVPRSGTGTRRIQSIHEGSALGWSWLFPPYRWEFDARAESPVRAIALEAAALRHLLEEDPVLGYRLLFRVAATMADRLQAARREVVSLAGP